MNGYRALWDGNNFYSRHGNLKVSPKIIMSSIPHNIPLDGELW